MSDKRPDKLTRVFLQLDLIATFSTCHNLRVASALIDESTYAVLLTSRNGVPAGETHCTELEKPNGRCTICVHSERNLLNFAGRYGITTDGLAVVALYRPCVSCANDLIQAGVVALYYRWDYDTDNKKEYVLEMLNRNMYVEQVPKTPFEDTFGKFINEDWMQTW